MRHGRAGLLAAPEREPCEGPFWDEKSTGALVDCPDGMLADSRPP